MTGRRVDKDEACACGHIFWQHFEDADTTEREEQPGLPEKGCAMPPCACAAFTRLAAPL